MTVAKFLHTDAQEQAVARGALLFQRGLEPTSVIYLESGRVALGVLDGEILEHQLGEEQGPCWLEASTSVLELTHVVDAVAETAVSIRRVPVAEFRRMLAGLSAPAYAVFHDVAAAHRHQSELAVSRMAKDAESRCAEWLLRHAYESERGAMTVQLQQRKRSIAAQLGIAPETFSRVLRHLREQSLISGSGRHLKLDDPPGLRSLAGD